MSEQDDTEQVTRWLSEPERLAWIDLMRVVSRLPAVLDAQLEGDAGLNFYEYMVLAMLAEQESRSLRMTDLAAGTNASLTRLSNVVKRFERSELVSRSSDPADGRFTVAV